VVAVYDVVLLIEQELTGPDAQRVVELHEQLRDEVRYHLVIPTEDAAAKVDASLASLAGTELYGLAAERYSVGSDEEAAKIQRDAQRTVDAQATTSLDRSIKRLQALDRQADGVITHGHPVDALVEQVKRVNGQEVIVLTRPHVVAEFFHIDWSARARRHLGVPVLHLLEQYQDSALEPGWSGDP
jgi:hypothetical protein